MLKRLAILAVLWQLAAVGILTGQDAPKGTPEQRIAKPSSGQNGQTPTEARDSTQSTPTPVPSSQEPTTPPCDEACQQGRENLKIQRELALFTLLLVVVGVLEVAVGGLQVGTMIWQAKLLRQTREDVHTQAEWMKTQAGHMKDQTKILGESVAAAQASADSAKAQIQMMKDKERTRLSIELSPVKTLTFGWLDFDNVGIQMENFGFTHALNVKATGGAVLSAFDNKEPDPPSNIEGFEVQDVVRSGETSALGFVSLKKRVTEKDINAEGMKWMIVVQGVVTYDDVFGNLHETRFKRYKTIWLLKKTDVSDVYEVSDEREWMKTENPEDNRAI